MPVRTGRILVPALPLERRTEEHEAVDEVAVGAAAVRALEDPDRVPAQPLRLDRPALGQTYPDEAPRRARDIGVVRRLVLEANRDRGTVERIGGRQLGARSLRVVREQVCACAPNIAQTLERASADRPHRVRPRQQLFVQRFRFVQRRRIPPVVEREGQRRLALGDRARAGAQLAPQIESVAVPAHGLVELAITLEHLADPVSADGEVEAGAALLEDRVRRPEQRVRDRALAQVETDLA